MPEYRNKIQDDRIKWLEDKFATINDEMGSVKKDIAEIKTDVSWLKQFFWVICSASIGSLIAALFNLLK